VQRWAEFARSVRQGASGARLAATVLDRMERRTRSGSRMGIITLSDPTGQYEAIIFEEGLSQYRDLLEKGSAVVVTVQASLEGDDVRARIIAVDALERAASRVQKGLRIFLRDDGPLSAIEARLKTRGEGEVSLVLMLEPDRSEVEMRLPGQFNVTAEIAGAIKAIPGIVAVEHV
jgi:DNA polymerase-3 subunit alpha